MKTIAWLLVLMVLACNKREEPPPPAAAAPEHEPSAEAPAPPEPAAAEKPAELKLDAAKAKAFVVYQEKMVTFGKNWVKNAAEHNKALKAGEYEGVTGKVAGLASVHRIGTEAGQELEAARKAAGLNEEEVAALSEIHGHVIARTMAGEKSAAQVAKMEQSIAALPEARRAEAQKGLSELKAAQERLMSLKEEREKYGDAIVDAMLAEGPTFVRLLKEQSSAAQPQK